MNATFSVLFYFLDFEGKRVVGAAWCGMLLSDSIDCELGRRQMSTPDLKGEFFVWAESTC